MQAEFLAQKSKTVDDAIPLLWGHGILSEIKIAHILDAYAILVGPLNSCGHRVDRPAESDRAVRKGRQVLSNLREPSLQMGCFHRVEQLEMIRSLEVA